VGRARPRTERPAPRGLATKPDDASRRQRLASLGAIAFVVAATSLAFGRVFTDRGPTLRLLLAGLLSVAVAAAFERRSLVLATLASGVALIATLGLLVYPETLWYGLPAGETLSAIGESLGRVGNQARTHVAPTPPLAPLMLAAITAVWTAAFSAHALAARAGSPLLAVLPSAALIGFADTVLEDGARPLYALLLLVSALVLVFADAMRRIRQWGPVWTAPGRRRLSTVAGRGARRVGAAAVGAALLVPGILPGFRADPLVDLSGPGGADIDIDPFVSILADLKRGEERDVFQVESADVQGNPVASYWRTRALDVFDGVAWNSSDPTGDRAFPLADSTVPPPDVIGSVLETAPTFRQRFTTTADVEERKWLPAAYPAQTIVVADGQEVRFQPEVAGLQAGSSIASDRGYTVTSYLMRPTAEQLDVLTIPSQVPGQWTYIPENVGAPLRALAEEWTADASTPYQKVFAIQQRFLEQDAFRYTEAPPKIPAGTNPILSFITETKQGFCQQFATAMAALVRSLGIPARVAIGYRPGTQAGDVFTVTNHDSHAWVEVLFREYGWLAFDPTPGTWENPLFEETSYLTGDTGVSEGIGTKEDESKGGERSPNGCILGGRPVQGRICFDPTAQPTSAQIGPGGPHPGFPGDRGALVGFGLEPEEERYGIPLRPVLAGLGIVVVALLVLVPLVKAALRRRMLSRGRDGRALVLSAYRVFDGEAAEVGMGRRPGETIAEHRERLSSTVQFSDGHLARLTAAAQIAAYADATLDTQAAHAARADAKVAIKDVWRQAGPLRRVLGLYRPKV
jgi:transglutaminase-like putative cysteine protease